MAKRMIRIGVVGLGRIGWKWHCLELNRHPDFSLVAVVDSEAERRQEAEQTYRVVAYSSLSAMLNDARLEAVTIATPSHLHREMAEQALAAGLHVMVEKPMAVTGQEAAAMVRAAARRQCILTVYQSLRSQAYFQQLQSLLASGLIGSVYHVRLAGYRYVRRDDWQSLRKYGGGVLNNAGSHLLDQLLQLIGYEIGRVFSDLKRIASLGDAEDFVKIVLETKQGAIGELDMNQASPDGPPGLQVWGTGGRLTLLPEQTGFSAGLLHPETLSPKRLNRSLASRDRRYPYDEIGVEERMIAVDPTREVDIYARFASAIRKGTAPFVRPEEALAVMRLIDRCRNDSGRVQRVRQEGVKHRRG